MERINFPHAPDSNDKHRCVHTRAMRFVAMWRHQGFGPNAAAEKAKRQLQLRQGVGRNGEEMPLSVLERLASLAAAFLKLSSRELERRQTEMEMHEISRQVTGAFSAVSGRNGAAPAILEEVMLSLRVSHRRC